MLTWPVRRLFQLVTCLDRSYIPMILKLLYPMHPF